MDAAFFFVVHRGPRSDEFGEISMEKNREVMPRMEMAHSHSTPLKTNISLKKMMVERCISYCNSPFFRGHVNFRGCK